MPRSISPTGPPALVGKQAPDLDAGLGILRVPDALAVLLSQKAVLRRIEGRDLDSGGKHQVHVSAALRVDAGRIGDQADALSLHGAEALIRPHIEACLHVAVPGDAHDAGPRRLASRYIR